MTTELRFGGQTIKFNQKATQWLKIQLDSHLNFGSYFNEKFKRAKTVKARIKGLSKTYGMPFTLIRHVQIVAIQSVILYDAELWKKNQKNHQNEIEKLINNQAC